VHPNRFSSKFRTSPPRLVAIRKSRFVGGWKYLEKALFEIPLPRVERAIVELGILIRALDNKEQISTYRRQVGEGNPAYSYGTIFKQDGTTESLQFRDLANKLIHATDFEWNFSDPDRPVLICTSDDANRWTKANVEVESLLMLAGQLGS
jgi:hypothetical protein